MRMALQFQIAAPTVSRRLQRDDERLKRAIGKHYKKLCMLERVKYTEFRFSECVTDLVLAMGFQQSERHPDELSLNSSKIAPSETVADVMSETQFTQYTESKYASIKIGEELDIEGTTQRSMADKVRIAKEMIMSDGQSPSKKTHKKHVIRHNRFDDLSDNTSYYVAKP